MMSWFMAATAISPAMHVMMVRHFGLDWFDVTHLRLWRLPTAELLAVQPGFVWAKVALAFVALPVAERRLGSRRTLIVFFLADWISTLTTFVVLRVASGMGDTSARALLHIRDVGPSAGAWALIVTVVLVLERRPVRIAGSAAAYGFLLLALVFHGRLFDAEHALAACVALGIVVAHRRFDDVLSWRADRRRRGCDRRPAQSTVALPRT
jgi:hypothetical protein